jgi:hypothetical protein
LVEWCEKSLLPLRDDLREEDEAEGSERVGLVSISSAITERK